MKRREDHWPLNTNTCVGTDPCFRRGAEDTKGWGVGGESMVRELLLN